MEVLGFQVSNKMLSIYTTPSFYRLRKKALSSYLRWVWRKNGIIRTAGTERYQRAAAYCCLRFEQSIYLVFDAWKQAHVMFVILSVTQKSCFSNKNRGFCGAIEKSEKKMNKSINSKKVHLVFVV